MQRVPLCRLLIVMLAFAAPAVAHDEDPPNLLGRCTAEQLDEEPFAEWSREEYTGYSPNAAILEELRTVDTDGTRFTVFFGTWCGDSRREVPRLLKLFDAMGLPEGSVELVGLDRTDEALKQSPDREERGKEIYRVPTLIVERNGEEISRLVEHPVLSLERDLLAILGGNDYSPSYAAYPLIRRWLDEGLLADPNVSPWGLAKQLRQKINGEGDLAAVARVLQSRGDLAEAIKLFEVNCVLHWENSRCHERLALALLEKGDRENARKAVERALRYNDNTERLGELTALLQETGEGSRSKE
jgi:tetratricopeptide (TPR) repeat protein